MSPKDVEIPGRFTDSFLDSISHELKTQIPKNNQSKTPTI